MVSRKAQTTIEVAMIFSIVMAGLLAIGVFWRSALRANIKGNTDMFSDDQWSLSSTETSTSGAYNATKGPSIEFSRVSIVVTDKASGAARTPDLGTAGATTVKMN